MSEKIVLITGANSGIGYAMTEALAQASEPYLVIMTGRSLEKVQKALDEIVGRAPRTKPVALALDVTSDDSIYQAAKQTEEDYGKLDILINNAAVGALDMQLREGYQACLETNVTGPAIVCEAFRPLLLKSKSAYSIFVGTGARSIVRNGSQKLASLPLHKVAASHAYQVSKAALNMLAVAEHRDHGPLGIKVFVMSPGFVRSNLRGTSEERVSGWGQAGDPNMSAELALSIIRGERDEHAGQLVHKDGVYEW